MSTKAYKILENDYTCKGFKYEIGQTNEMPENDIKWCSRGFHACHFMHECFKYYSPIQWNKFVEVELFGKIIGDKSDKYCASKIKIIREISFNEMIEILKEQLNNINGSDGINGSKGINGSYGILNCHGISNELFNCNKKPSYKIFNKKVSEERFEAVKNKLYDLLNGWYPKSNNLFKLKLNKEWYETPVTKAKSYDKLDWSDMPKKL